MHIIIEPSEPCLASWDHRVSPILTVLGKHIPVFHAFGTLGAGAALLLATGLTRCLGLSLNAILFLMGLAVFTFWIHSLAVKILTLKETFVYLRHVVTLVPALLLSGMALGLSSSLAHAEVVMLAVGLLQATGRFGCFMAGCCHGRPHGWGICYGDAHVAAGFPAYLRGVRLFPVQAVEAFWGFLCVVTGSGLLLAGFPTGSGLSSYLVLYGLGRFFLEFHRGDTARAFLGPFSEAQCLSVLLMLGVLFAAAVQAIPFFSWHVLAFAGPASAGCILAVSPSHRQTARLFRPAHVKELAARLSWFDEEAKDTSPSDGASQPAIVLTATGSGIRISTESLAHEGAPISYIAFSSQDHLLSHHDARRLARLCLRLVKQPAALLFEGRPGIFHLLAGNLAVISTMADTSRIPLTEPTHQGKTPVKA
ncbi:prolipoprotein diacylglyceryl transferase family protein [Desulfoluna butyratoxydans]|uniref:Prolipoprotein diacylglyceryl transferase n=1 Tax=Desulfoluna butyratoxydans TaxID=231438 RepID=A0A4U8YSL9_9BACT|nr:prolipoprotein diacylglyceryl transferase family protein [Desulfoluna butyratoxydans]VFQ46339.1 prolipoprotein diacylglyceryl transferase [Desulfoluna butyratoxydans]